MKNPPNDSRMPARVVDKIAVELNLAKDEADALLSEFVGALLDEVRTSGEAIVPGIGSFRYLGDRLTFEPDADLQAAVNVRFEGLERLEVSKRPLETDTPGVAPDADVSEGATHDEELGIDPAVPVVDDELSSADLYDEPSEDFADMGYEQEGDDETSDPVELPDESIHADEDDAETELPPFVPHSVAIPDEEPAFTRSAPEHDVPADEPPHIAESAPDRPPVPDKDLPYLPGDQPAPDDEYPLPPDLANVPDPTRRRQRGTTRAWIISSVIVLILIAAGIFLLVGDRDAGDFPNTFEGLTAIENNTATEPDLSSDEALADDDTLQAAPPAEAEPEPPIEEASPLYGDAIDTSVSNYTLFVASLPTEARADQVAEQWRARGIRAAVFAESTDAGLRYRVGIGQFETIAMADSVRLHSAITPELPEGTWIRRYPATTAN